MEYPGSDSEESIENKENDINIHSEHQTKSPTAALNENSTEILPDTYSPLNDQVTRQQILNKKLLDIAWEMMLEDYSWVNYKDELKDLMEKGADLECIYNLDVSGTWFDQVIDIANYCEECLRKLSNS